MCMYSEEEGRTTNVMKYPLAAVFSQTFTHSKIPWIYSCPWIHLRLTHLWKLVRTSFAVSNFEPRTLVWVFALTSGEKSRPLVWERIKKFIFKSTMGTSSPVAFHWPRPIQVTYRVVISPQDIPRPCIFASGHLHNVDQPWARWCNCSLSLTLQMTCNLFKLTVKHSNHLPIICNHAYHRQGGLWFK